MTRNYFMQVFFTVVLYAMNVIGYKKVITQKDEKSHKNSIFVFLYFFIEKGNPRIKTLKS